MKPLTVQLPDDIYERAERRAADHGATLSGEAAKLIKLYSDGSGNGRSEAMPPRESSSYGVKEVVQELATVAEECRLPNWDGQGAIPVNQETLDNACRLVNAIPGNYPLPSVGVEPDGHLTLEWYRNPKWILSLSITPGSIIYYAALFGTNDVRGREFYVGDVPDIILNLVQRVFTP